MKILVVEDNKEISKILEAYLAKEGYSVCLVYDGESALEEFASNYYDLVILDLMLPIYSGEEVLNKIRETSTVPVIILSAKTGQESKLYGLVSGADDYITKPFSAKEVVARVNALFRRIGSYSEDKQNHVYDDGCLKVNFSRMEVLYKNKTVVLTVNEFKVLSTLINNEQITLSREQIINNAFSGDFDGFDRNVDTYIKNIRNKIGKSYIATVYSVGYKFVGACANEDK